MTCEHKVGCILLSVRCFIKNKRNTDPEKKLEVGVKPFSIFKKYTVLNLNMN